MTTRAKTRSKPDPFPVIQEKLTPLFETYSTEDGFGKLTDVSNEIKTASRNLREITKQAVSKCRQIFILLITSVETTWNQGYGN